MKHPVEPVCVYRVRMLCANYVCDVCTAHSFGSRMSRIRPVEPKGIYGVQRLCTMSAPPTAPAREDPGTSCRTDVYLSCAHVVCECCVRMFSQKLKMCLEPEAACLSVEHNNMQPWLTGTNLMILDCGGGTIDITTHQVVETAPLSLKELNEPTGGPWGSTVLDAKFKQFLKV